MKPVLQEGETFDMTEDVGADAAGLPAQTRTHHRYETRSSSKLQSDDEGWSPLRAFLAKFVKTDGFDVFMVSVIIINMVFVVIEADASADQEAPGWMTSIGYVFLGIYIVEISLRLFVERLQYLHSKLNVVDLCIVSADVVFQILIDSLVGQFPSISILRIFRVMRLIRVIRAFSGARELWLMLHGLKAAMKAMLWACVLICVVLTIWSVVSVQSLHPVAKDIHLEAGFNEECVRCHVAFSSVTRAMVTWFLLVFCGELWSDLAVPILEKLPASALVFISAFITINLGMLNLILTVIVDRASEARADDENEKVLEKKSEFNRASNKLMKLCIEMDEDNSGELTLEELETGYEKNPDFVATLRVMDVGKDDIKTVFAILDEDKSGTVTYDEFVDQLHKMKSQESHTLLVFIKHYITDVRLKVTEILNDFKAEIKHHDAHAEAEMQEFKRAVTKNLHTVEDMLAGASGGAGVEPETPGSVGFGAFDSEEGNDRPKSSKRNAMKLNASNLKEGNVQPLLKYIDEKFAGFFEEAAERSKQVSLLNESMSKLLGRSSDKGFRSEMLKDKDKEIGAVIVPIMMARLGAEQEDGKDLVYPVQVIRPGNGGRDRQFMM